MSTLTDYDYSILALDSYFNRPDLKGKDIGGNKPPEAVNTPLTDAYGLQAIYQASDSAGFGATLNKTSSNHYIISYRGTDDYLSDIDDDLDLYVGSVPPQFASALNFYNLVKSYLGISSDQISLAGHSLGGCLASMVSAVTGSKAVVIDPAPSNNAISALGRQGYYGCCQKRIV